MPNYKISVGYTQHLLAGKTPLALGDGFNLYWASVDCIQFFLNFSLVLGLSDEIIISRCGLVALRVESDL